MSLAQSERAALVETLRALGPDRPTMCEGWTTLDLTTHLVAREARPDAMPGIALRPFAGHTQRVQDSLAQQPWDQLLDRLASGPPCYSPFKLVDRWANLLEMFIHHEDALRGGADPDGPWSPRVLTPELEKALVRLGKPMARMMLRSSPATVTLLLPEGQEFASGGAGAPVSITGGPGELLLWAVGRAPAEVTMAGDSSAIAALAGQQRGF